MPNKKTMKKGLQTRISYVNLTLENLMAERREHDMKIVGERMKKLREEAGISQNKLAKLIGIQQSSLAAFPTPRRRRCFGSEISLMCQWTTSSVGQINPREKCISTNPVLIPT